MAKLPTYEEMAKNVADKVLDEVLYNEKSIREWIKIIREQESIIDILDKIKKEISDRFEDCDICEWIEDYDWDENDISEYRSIGNINDILKIIDKYKNND